MGAQVHWRGGIVDWLEAATLRPSFAEERDKRENIGRCIPAHQEREHEESCSGVGFSWI